VYNVRGQLTDNDIGNGLHTHKGYDDYGFPSSIVTESGSVQDLSFNFDPTTGNLNWRANNTNGLSLHENFSYDTYQSHTRLTHWGENSQDKYTVLYNPNGNILGKTDITVNSPNCFQYNSSKPHAVTKIDNTTQEYQAFVQDNDQVIQYNTFQKTDNVIQGNKKLEFVYGPDQARKIMKYYEKEDEDWVLKRTKYYILGNYEIEQDNQTNETRELIYINGFAIIEHKSTGENNTYYLHTDYLGSLETVTDESGGIVKRYSFDPWGRRRNPDTWKNLTFAEIQSQDFIFDRGFTGHEHLDEFGLINMNGRMYDPLLGRMLSPDNYVQAPDNSQNFNRYSYCLNNPLMYTDPSGELYIWDDVIVGAVGFGFGYVSYGITNGDWGWKAVGAGVIGAGTALLGYYSGGVTSAASIADGFSAVSGGHAATVALGYSGRYVASAAISSMLPSISIPVGDNFCVNVSPGVGFGSGGLVGGVNVSGTYNDGTTVVSGGYGVTGNSSSWSIGAMHNGYGGSYYRTSYGDAIGPDGRSNSQVVGGIGLNFNKVSVRLENDFFGDGYDRWRSNALEIGIGNFVFGTNLYNNFPGPQPGGENQDVVNLPDRRGNYNTDGYGAWRNGKVYNSPWYAGYRSGNNVTRWGYSHPSAQDWTQNNVHRLVPFGRQNYYVDYTEFTSGPYMYSGFYNPYSLW
jgi:RHS repeat-associated protein